MNEQWSQVRRRFVHHPPSTPAVAAAHEAMRDLFLGVALALVQELPPCPEKDRAVDALDDACKHANAAIARTQMMADRVPPPE